MDDSEMLDPATARVVGRLSAHKHQRYCQINLAIPFFRDNIVTSRIRNVTKSTYF